VGQADGRRHGPEILPHEGHIAGLHGHVGAGADGDADIGRGQGRGVVDAVPHHGHHLAVFLQSVNFRGLVFRQDLRKHGVDPEGRSDRPGRPDVVTGDHGDLQPHIFKGRHGLSGGISGDVRKADETDDVLAPGDIDAGFTCAGQMLLLLFPVPDGKTETFQIATVAQQAGLTGDASLGPQAGSSLECLRCFG